jgi:glutamate/tyrosine decarboxylase-like PLP-dependent enzyme
VPYDCGVAIVADGEAHAAAMSATAEYLIASDDGLTKTPEMSRRGRQIPVYAAMRHLGRKGIGELVERCCAHASRLAAAMARLDGAEVLNDVVLNQVLLRFDGDDERTSRVIEELQRGGEAWLGGTVWHGVTAARVAFSNWSTTDADVDRLASALEDALEGARAASPVR